MSAQKDPVRLARLLGQVRSLVRMHRDMGLRHYPALPGLVRLLERRGTADQAGSSVAARQSTTSSWQGPGSGAAQGPGSGPAAGAARSSGPGRGSLPQPEPPACGTCPLALEGQAPDPHLPATETTRPVLLFIGDHPPPHAASGSLVFGQEEDAMVGRMAAALGLDDGAYAQLNLVCRAPRSAETGQGHALLARAGRACVGRLMARIEALAPQGICVMGDLPCQVLFQAPLARRRGQRQDIPLAGRQVPAMPTFHPRYLLQEPRMKKAAWHDLQLLRSWIIAAQEPSP